MQQPVMQAWDGQDHVDYRHLNHSVVGQIIILLFSLVETLHHEKRLVAVKGASELCFTQNTHFEPIMFIPNRHGTKSQVWFISSAHSSLGIATIQLAFHGSKFSHHSLASNVWMPWSIQLAKMWCLDQFIQVLWSRRWCYPILLTRKINFKIVIFSW